MVFSSSENCPKIVTSSLENEVPHFTDSTIHDLLINIENIIASSIIDPDSAFSNLDHSITPDFNDDESAANNSDPDWQSDDNSNIHISPQDKTQVQEKIRRDLRVVKKAGFKVGYLGSKHGTIIVSVSCRISKLGISEEAMNAWGVKPSEYFVLLMRYRPNYLDLQTVLEAAGDLNNKLVQMHVGLCDSYKPSFEHAIGVIEGQQDHQTKDKGLDSNATIGDYLLKPLFIGRSLNSLLRERLFGIIKLRLKHQFSWTGAELFFQSSQGRIYSSSDASSEKYRQPDNWASSAPAILVADHMAELNRNTSHLSLPLLAIQFTLRHFVKCTEFCLVCHCKTGDTFEALKPYVCSNGLCLYQYMALDMGPSLEYEIRSQPVVVDLLVSLAYARSISGNLEDFPTGLRLRVPEKMFAVKAPGITPYQIAELDAAKLDLHTEFITPVKVGDWIVIMEGGYMYPGISEWHCRVEHLDETSKHISISLPICQGHQLQPEELPTQLKLVKFVVYDTNLDDLTPFGKQKMIYTLLNVLPSVQEMKRFTGSHGRLLSSWQDVISPAGLDLLRWIVASNRSFITQGGDEPKHQVTGMSDYVQFRLVQGAADKEQRFVNAVNSTSLAKNPNHPTLFAWHGSPLQNWHSILREGLHFKHIANGRACGNGVYMSDRFHTSLGYTQHRLPFKWPDNRRLKLAAVISLNEVVNAPDHFVSRTPHYVVQHLDWVQPRYLFVKLQDSNVSANNSLIGGSTPHSSSHNAQVIFYKQDELHPAIGPDGKIINIPISIFGGQRGRSFLTAGETQSAGLPTSPNGRIKRRKYSVGTTKQSDNDDSHSVETSIEDISILLSDDELPGSPKQEENVLDPSAKTDFQPGTLKEDSLPTLAPPKYATTSATKILQQHLNATIKIQKKVPLHELGWYVDLNLITTVYRWIVELHTFDPDLPLAKDLKAMDLKSVVLELRFPPQFPMDPPLVRVIRPRFLEFAAGGGGHVTAGGSMCMELLTHSGWLPTASIESILLQVRMALSSTDPRPARLNLHSAKMDYSVAEAVEAYKRVSMAHGWEISRDIQQLTW